MRPYNPRDDVGRLYVSKKEGGRRDASIEDSTDASTRRMHKKQPEMTQTTQGTTE